MLACIVNGPESISWEAATDSGTLAVLLAASQLSVAATNPRCAEAGFQSILDDDDTPAETRWGAVLGLQGLLVAEGRVEEALDLLDLATSSISTQAYTLYTLDHLVDTSFELKASETAALARRFFGESYERAGPTLQWQMGIWHSRRAHADQVERVAASVRELAGQSDERRTKLLANALEGHLALARAATTDAIELFGTLTPTAPGDSMYWSIVEPLAVEKLILAQLLMARGEHERAHEVAAIYDYPQAVMFLPYLAVSLSIRLKAAEALGQAQAAERYRVRLEALGRSDLAGSEP